MVAMTERLICILVLGTAAAAATAQAPRDYTGDCTKSGCHDAYAKLPVIHDPVASGSCDACHEPREGADHKFDLTESGAALCYECHDEDEFKGKVRHSPFSDGQCTACHDPHGSASKKLLLQPTSGRLCAECHEEVTEGLKYLHGPVAAGACSGCHDAHASDHAGLLLKTGTELCLQCHESLRTRLAGAPHVHDPVAQACDSCHNPHGGDNPMVLTGLAPALCLDCHDAVGERMEEVVVKHDPMTQGKSCAECHDAHASAVRHLLLRPEKDLCLSCHNRVIESADGQLSDIAGLLVQNPHHHDPVDDGCSACHAAHGSNVFRLVSGAYPQAFYAPFKPDDYALCFDCHDSELVESEKTDEATGFRNGEQNLHYVHVNRASKGRTCRACHVVHAGRHPKLIADRVPFGSWELPVGFQPSETGGTCQSGCHRPYRYDRNSPIQNIPSS